MAREVYEIRFTKPAEFTFLPGQFILFAVPLMEKPEDIQTRALSIASTTEEEELLFIAKLVPGGRISRWIEEVLKPGATATFKGPFGKFVIDPETPNDYLFVATGAGIAPFRPMIFQALGAQPRPHPARATCATLSQREREGMHRIDLVFGVRSEEDLFWEEWLEETSKVHENLHHHIALSQPSSAWTGHRGRVQTVTPEIVKGEFTGKTLYVCGNPDMTNDVKRLALTEWGMERKDVHVEGYI